LISYGTNITRPPLNPNADSGNISSNQEIVVSGSSMAVGNKLQSLCDLASLEQFKRLHLTKHSINENVVSSTSPSTPK